jgi:glycosyltransferase involved in cell wall biosynthesis
MTGRERPAEVVLFTDTAGFGGAEQMLLALATGLDRGRWRPVIAHHPDGADVLAARADALEIERWPVPRMPDGATGARRLPRYVRSLRRRRPAVLHAHLTWPLACKFGLLGAVAARVPAVAATVQLFLDHRPTALASVQYRLLTRSVGRWIAVSSAVADGLEHTLDWPPDRIEVVYNAVDPGLFTVEPDPVLRSELSGGGVRPVVLSLARLDPQKHLTVLLRAAARVPTAQFVLAGDGPERGRLEALAAELGLGDRVSFLGLRSDVPRLLASCDVVVLSSINEGLPVAALEAMAASRPVVASAVAGTLEAVVDGETGLLVPEGDPESLAAALRSVLDDRAQAMRMGAAGRARVVAKFAQQEMVDRVSSVYEQLLAAGGGPA